MALAGQSGAPEGAGGCSGCRLSHGVERGAVTAGRGIQLGITEVGEVVKQVGRDVAQGKRVDTLCPPHHQIVAAGAGVEELLAEASIVTRKPLHGGFAGGGAFVRKRGSGEKAHHLMHPVGEPNGPVQLHGRGVEHREGLNKGFAP